MSQAYQSTLNISFDIRGGLLIRQIHHWAADLFMVAITAHMLRVFFTGAYRKPREVNWLIGIVLFTLGLIEGLFGYSLPDDQLSGAGLRVFEGILQGIPVVGTYAAFFLFGGAFPGTSIIPRMYILHVFLIPGLILALVTAHLFIMFHQKHTQMPALGNTEKNVVGQPFFPYFLLKGQAWFFFIFGSLVLLATFAQINPVWLYGPYTPLAISAGTQPDWYLGLLDGALRVMPPWEINFLGHTLTLSRAHPVPRAAGGDLGRGGAVAVLRAVGDRRQSLPPHQRPAAQRPGPDRDRGGGGDLLRGAVGRERQRRHRRPVQDPAVHAHLDRAGDGRRRAGGRVRRHPADLHRPAAQGQRPARARGRDRHHPAAARRRVRRGAPAADRRRARAAEARNVPALLPAPGSSDGDGVSAPQTRGLAGRARAIANRAFAETIPFQPNGHGNGHAPGNAAAQADPHGLSRPTASSGSPTQSTRGDDES